MAYFPLFMDIEQQKILVVGGGRIAERRIETLLPFGCRIVVVSPSATEKILGRRDEGKIQVILTDFSTFLACHDGTEGFWMVLAATDDSEVNREAAAFGRREGALVNRADCREDSDFYFPGIVKKGPLVIGVTASGEDHKLAKRVTDAVRKLVDTELML